MPSVYAQHMPNICPTYAHFIGALTGSIRPYLSDCFRCPQGVWEGMRKNCVLWQKSGLPALKFNPVPPRHEPEPQDELPRCA